MTSNRDPEQNLSVVLVPEVHAETVREFVASLIEEQAPDVEGYAALVKGIGSIGGGFGGPILNSITGSECAVTAVSPTRDEPRPQPSDFDCGDED